jgi:hypothetical protein
MKVITIILLFVLIAQVHAHAWSATFYGGSDDPNQDKIEQGSGACWKARAYKECWGGTCFESITGPKLVAAISTRNGENTKKIGKCFRVQCIKGAKRGFSWSFWGIVDPCISDESIEVMITDSCPCGKNADNTQNCCKKNLDLSKWAFERIADPKWGVIDIETQEVPCSDPSGKLYGVKLSDCCKWPNTRCIM